MPRTETERRVAAIWSELFRLNAIGIHDDLFELGGDSMTGVALLAHLQVSFDLNLELATLFERPTIAGLSELVDIFILTNRETGSNEPAEQEEFEL